ncbi:hypothetical protein RBB80_08255 [Tunturiibacter gelidiferens]
MKPPLNSAVCGLLSGDGVEYGSRFCSGRAIGVVYPDLGSGIEELATLTCNPGSDVRARSDGNGLVEAGLDAGCDRGDALEVETPSKGFAHEGGGYAAVEDAVPTTMLFGRDVYCGASGFANGLQGTCRPSGSSGPQTKQVVSFVPERVTDDAS